MKTLRFAFIGLISGLILSTFARRSVWLEMRINTGLLLPLAMAITILAGTFSNKQPPAIVAVGMEIFLISLVLLVYKFDPDALLVILASALKEGFFLYSRDFRTMNGILAAIILLGNCILFAIPGYSKQ